MVGYQLSEMDRFKWIGRPHLIRAQGRKCFYCGKFMASGAMTRDHLRPKSAGYTLLLNQVVCCRTCNLKKGTRWPTPREMKKACDMYVRLGAPAFMF